MRNVLIAIMLIFMGLAHGADLDDLVIRASNVAGNLTGFPVLITGDALNAGFWAGTVGDGSDIWLENSDDVKLKREVTYINKHFKELELWVKTDLSGSVNTVITLHFGDTGLSETNDADTWDANFKTVYHFGNETDGVQPDSGQAGNDGDVVRGIITLESDTSLISPDIVAHQGIAWDGTYYYIIQSTGSSHWVKKFNTSWVQVGSTYETLMTDIESDIGHEDGSTAYDHIGDGSIYDGKLYLPVQENSASNDGTDGDYSQAIAIINTNGANDMTYDSAVALWGDGSMTYEVDGIYIDGTSAYIVTYVTSAAHVNAQRIRVWNFPAWTPGTDITMSSGLVFLQGIVNYKDGFLVSDSISIHQINTDGTVFTHSVWDNIGDGDVEGLTYRSDLDSIHVLVDHAADPSNESLVYGLRSIQGNIGSQADFDSGDNIVKHIHIGTTTDFEGLSAITIECWAKLESISDARRFMRSTGGFSLEPEDSGTYNHFQFYDTSAWKPSDEFPFDVTGDYHHYAMTWDKTIDSGIFKFYFDGATLGTASARTTDMGSGFSDFFIGTATDASSSLLDGQMDEFRISNSARSPEWITTAYNNQSDPVDFVNTIAITGRSRDGARARQRYSGR